MADRIALVTGVANQYSIAWAVAQQLTAQGVQVIYTYQGERVKDKVLQLVDEHDPDAMLLPCDVTRDEQIEAVFEHIGETCGRLDYFVHSIAFARKEELSGRLLDTTRKGFALAEDISAYSLIPFARHARPLMKKSGGGSILAMTYLGSQQVVPNYNVMGLCKATLEAAVRYLAADLGPDNIRVNAVSAGPIRTLAARGISGFSQMLEYAETKAPLRRNVTAEEVGKSSAFLLGDGASGITGQTVFVDAGYSIMGM